MSLLSAQEEEVYVCIYSHRTADTILFHHQGGVDIGDVDAKALKLEVPVGKNITIDEITNTLLVNLTNAKKLRVANFIHALYQSYVNLYFTYLEINPLVVTKDSIYVLDLAAKLDSTADFICRPKWGDIEYPPPFGRDAYPEEAYIADLDAKSGASLKVNQIWHFHLLPFCYLFIGKCISVDNFKSKWKNLDNGCWRRC